jgi:hypothetical protein
MSSIYEFVRAQRDSYRTDTIEITDGYEFSQYETLRASHCRHRDFDKTGSAAHVLR